MHIRPSEYTAKMTERELASLLYRDHLSLKHADRQRLHSEIKDVQRKENRGSHSEDEVEGIEEVGDVDDVDPLLKALLDHLKEVGLDSWTVGHDQFEVYPANLVYVSNVTRSYADTLCNVKPCQVSSRDKVVFSMPEALLQDATKSIPDVIKPRASQTKPPAPAALENNIQVINDSDTENVLEALADDGENLMATGVRTDLFGAGPSCPAGSHHGSVFFSITEGSMSRRTLSGERPQRFDFLIQRYVVCSQDADVVHLVPFGAPLAIDLCTVPFTTLIQSLIVWKMGDPNAAPNAGSVAFVHGTSMILSPNYIINLDIVEFLNLFCVICLRPRQRLIF